MRRETEDFGVLSVRMGDDTVMCVPMMQGRIRGGEGALFEPVAATVYVFDTRVAARALYTIRQRPNPNLIAIRYMSKFVAYVMDNGSLVDVKNTYGAHGLLTDVPTWLSDMLSGGRGDDVMVRMRTLQALREL